MTYFVFILRMTRAQELPHRIYIAPPPSALLSLENKKRGTPTMCWHIHQIIHLNIHVITSCSEPFVLHTNHLSTLLLTFQNELPSFVNLCVITMVLPCLEGLYASSPWSWGGPLLLRQCRGVSVGKRGEGEKTNLCPSQIKVLSPLMNW